MDLTTSNLEQTDFAAIAGNLRAATGGAAPHQALRLMRELAQAAGPGELAAAEATGALPEAGGEAIVAAIEAAIALAPRDPLEGMLVSQMAAVHAAAMRCLGRAAECAGHPQIEARYLREAARMLHLFQRQTETLDRRAKRFGPPKEDAAGAGQAAAGAEAAETAEAADPADRAAARRVGRKIAAIFAGGAADNDGGGAAQAAASTTPDPNDLANFLADLHARERERRRVEGTRRTAGRDRESRAAP